MVIKFEKTESRNKHYSTIHQKYKRNSLDIVLFISNDTELYLAISDSATDKDKVDIFTIEELSYQIINDTLVIDDKNLVRILDFAETVSDETYLFKNIPHTFFEGDVTPIERFDGNIEDLNFMSEEAAVNYTLDIFLNGVRRVNIEVLGYDPIADIPDELFKRDMTETEFVKAIRRYRVLTRKV